MEISKLLEEDKERVLNRLETARDAQQYARVMEEELGRLLCLYNEECRDDLAARMAGSTIQTAKAALPLMDSLGEIRTYERTAVLQNTQMTPMAAAKEAPVRILTGCLLLMLSFLTAASGRFSPWLLMPLSLILMAAGGWTLYRAGMTGHDKKNAPKSEIITEVRLDPEKALHHLSTILTVIDKELEELELITPVRGLSSEIELQADVPLMEEELKLFSALLQAAYMLKGQPYAREMVADIRYYLHSRAIEVEDYDESTARHFDCLPSAGGGTIRPALVQGGTLLSKGLAATG